MDTKVKMTIGAVAVAGALLLGFYFYMHSSKSARDSDGAYQSARAETYNAPAGAFRPSEFRKGSAISPPTMMPISSSTGKTVIAPTSSSAIYYEPTAERLPSYPEREPMQTEEEDVARPAASQPAPSSQQPVYQQPSIIMGIPVMVSGGEVASGSTSTGTGGSASYVAPAPSSGGETPQPPPGDEPGDTDDIADFVPQTIAGGPVDENAGAKSTLPSFTPNHSSEGPVRAEDDMM